MSKTEVVEEKKLKLYVVGESSGNPDDWSDNHGYSIVLAANEREAQAVSTAHGPLAEIRASRACELAFVRQKLL
jgi:hypothetical protein